VDRMEDKENPRRSSSIQTEREKISWATKKMMDILKAEEVTSLICEANKKVQPLIRHIHCLRMTCYFRHNDLQIQNEIS